jgi:hypothetical protein
MCRDKDNYHSVSVRNYAFSKLGVLTNKVIPGTSLSRAKVVEKLINDSFNSLNLKQQTINETKQQQQKI